MVQVAAARGRHRGHHLGDEARDHERHAVLGSLRQDDFSILLVQADAKGGLEVPLQHFLPVRVEDLLLGEAAEQHLAHLGRIDSGFLRQH